MAALLVGDERARHRGALGAHARPQHRFLRPLRRWYPGAARAAPQRAVGAGVRLRARPCAPAGGAGRRLGACAVRRRRATRGAARRASTVALDPACKGVTPKHVAMFYMIIRSSGVDVAAATMSTI